MPLASHAQKKGGGGTKKTTPSNDPFAAPAKGKAKNVPANEDPFASGASADELRAAKEANKPKTIQVTYEAFSLPMKDAAAHHRTGLKDADLYEKMVAGVKSGEVQQEKLIVGRTRSGQKITVEHSSEHIYNTEVEPPELPNIVSVEHNTKPSKVIIENVNAGENRGGGGSVFPGTPASPTSYDTRKVGDNMELEAMIGANVKYIDLRISVSHTSLVDYVTWGQGLSEAKMPLFSHPHIITGIVVMDGIPAFAGSVSPPKELQPESEEQRTWWAFVTADVVSH